MSQFSQTTHSWVYFFQHRVDNQGEILHMLLFPCTHMRIHAYAYSHLQHLSRCSLSFRGLIIFRGLIMTHHKDHFWWKQSWCRKVVTRTWLYRCLMSLGPLSCAWDRISQFDFSPYWPLATLWLTDKLSQSALTYKHTSLDRPVVCPSTIVVLTKHVAVLFSKTRVKRFGVM